MPNARAPSTSHFQLSPTWRIWDAGTPERRAVSAKIRGSGLHAPTSVEATTWASRISPAPSKNDFQADPDREVSVVTTTGTPTLFSSRTRAWASGLTTGGCSLSPPSAKRWTACSTGPSYSAPRSSRIRSTWVAIGTDSTGCPLLFNSEYRASRALRSSPAGTGLPSGLRSAPARRFHRTSYWASTMARVSQTTVSWRSRERTRYGPGTALTD